MQSFDASSGLVYRESTSASVRSMIPTWTTNFRGRRVDPSKHRSALGCDTLQEMALRTCIWNIDNIEPEALQWLGWSYAGRLYNHIKSTWVKERIPDLNGLANPCIQRYAELSYMEYLSESISRRHRSSLSLPCTGQLWRFLAFCHRSLSQARRPHADLPLNSNI
jgi:hypothetical protein